jgi:hypothetical protein
MPAFFSRSSLALLFLPVLLSFPKPLSAQIGPYDQSSSGLSWKTMQTEFVKLIYPDYMKPKAQQVANDIEYFSKSVGASYGISRPQQITLILRPEFADPNGFVTLAPRRSEWHAMSTFSPITSALDWYQILSIHEYRHVNQFDNFNKESVKILDYLFGDTGIILASAVSLQPWYFEGDAVWAETNYTDAGRGRLPNFFARLKGILLGSEGIPTYDQFLNGSYRRPLVNQYVYGYILINAGYKRFGENFWGKVIDDVSKFPNPWRLESAFKRVSKMDFKDFYNETFRNLKKEWSDKTPGDWAAKPYSEETNAHVFGEDSYFVSWDLNSFHSIMHRRNGELTKIAEIPYSMELTRVDFSPTHAVYNELRPDWRFGQKSSSDLALIDLKDGSKRIITADQRLYNPHFNADHSAILAVEFSLDKAWKIVELDLDGKLKRSLELQGFDLMEATALSGDTLALIANDKNGYKSFLIASFEKGLITTVIPPSRNTIFGLQSDGKSKILFEGQVDGAQEILLYDHEQKHFSRCTKSPIASYTPAFANAALTYASETPNGLEIKTSDWNGCSKVSLSDLTDYQYLGRASSSSYAAEAPKKLPDLARAPLIKPEQLAEEDYNRFESRAFTPHSWSFFAGRGLGLNLAMDNYLNDFSIDLQLGEEEESSDPYSFLQVDFKMLPVVFSVLADARKRSFEIPKTAVDVEWREMSYGGQLSLPYMYKRGLYNLATEIGHRIEKVKADEYEVDDIKGDSADRNFVRNSSFASLAFLKDHRFRSIQSPLGLSLSLIHDETKEDEGQDIAGNLHSWRNFADLRIYLPGIFDNHGIRLGLSGEKKSTNQNRYEFTAPPANPGEYVLARGYDYELSDEFTKATGDYLLPLAYPDYNLGRWLYIKQIYAVTYYDYSRLVQGEDERILASTGLEAHLETKILRFLPLELGLRYIRKLENQSDHFEGFLSSNLAAF